MSGTSIDAVDAVLIQITDQIDIIESHSSPIPQALKDIIIAVVCFEDIGLYGWKILVVRIKTQPVITYWSTTYT